MTFVERTRKLNYLEWLLRSQRVGSSRQLSCKLEVSARTIKRMIEELRNLGINVKYCPRENTYFIDKN